MLDPLQIHRWLLQNHFEHEHILVTALQAYLFNLQEFLIFEKITKG